MKITIAAVGRMGRGPEQELLEIYRRRMNWPVDIVEVEEKRPITGPERQKSETAKLRAAIPKGATIIILDEHGQALSSEAFAKSIEAFREQAINSLCFIIGGAGGFAADLKQEARMALAFGPQTWPHMLVRVMLMEHLYRAQTILAGHPYHRG